MRFPILRGIKTPTMKRINAVNRNYAQTMTTAEAKFREIEFSANRALAYAILATEAPSRYVMFYRLLKVLATLEKFISFLTADYLETLTASQEHRIGLCMQKAHTILARSLRSPGADTIVRFPLLRSLVTRLQERTDDLADVLEGMFLAGDPQPKALMAACEAHIEACRKTNLPENTIDVELFSQFERLCKQWRLTDPGLGSNLDRVVLGISQRRIPHQRRRVQASDRLELYIYRPASKNLCRGQNYDWRIIALSEKASGVTYPVVVYRMPVGSDVENGPLKQVLADVIREMCLRLGRCAVPDCDGAVRPVEPTERAKVSEVTQIKNRCSKCRTIYWRTEST
jgi:hypothetical protein